MQTTPHGDGNPRLRVAFLGSGSAGNSTAVTFGTTTVLVDAGFSAKETVRRLEVADVDPASVRAIIVTHEHGDHVRGVRVLAKRLAIPVYASPGTLAAATLGESVDDARTIRRGEHITVGDLSLAAFGTSHDAREPIGIRFDSPCGSSFGLATDTGIMTGEALEVLSGCTILGIEANHDTGMLNNGPYPRFLKQRIASAHGHLSNDAAAEALVQLAHDGLREVYALHLSRTNNMPLYAARSLSDALEKLQHPAESHCVGQIEGLTSHC